MSVSTSPGATMFTWMPYGRSSFASPRAKASIAALPGSLSTRLFVDTGTVWLLKDTRDGLASFGLPNHYNLSGVGVGFNWSLPNGLTANLEAATRIGNNPGASLKGYDADGRDNDSRGWVGVTWAY